MFSIDEIYCGEPPTLQFADFEKEPLKQYSVGDTVTYTCQFGYTKRGKSSVLECAVSDSEQNAEWTQPRFSCTRKLNDKKEMTRIHKTAFI